MALIYQDRVKEQTSTTGTSDFVLGGAVSGYRSFASVCADGDSFFYTAINSSGTEWECGLGYFSSTATLQRSTIYSSSTGAKVDFSAGIKEVFISANSGAMLEGVQSVDSMIPSRYISTSATTAVIRGGISARIISFGSIGTLYPSLTSIDFPDLTVCTNYSLNNSFRLSKYPVLQSITANSLIHANAIYIWDNPLLTTIYIQALTEIGRVLIYNNPELVFAVMTYARHVYNEVSIRDNPKLTSLQLGVGGPLLRGVGGNFDISGNALPSSSIDYCLGLLAGMDGTNGTWLYTNRNVNMSGGTNGAPSATGLAYKGTLVSRGCTVTHN